MQDFYDSIVLFAQPLYSLRKQSTVGFEVLARWNGMEDLGASYVLDQIDAICNKESDKSKCYKHFDMAILIKLLEFIKCNHISGFDFNINISKYTLSDSRAVEDMVGVIHSYNVANCITIELNEGSKVYKPEHIYNIGKLHRAGIRVSLDDFNTMNSGISVLSRLNIDEIKFKQLGFGEFTEKDVVLLKAVKSAADGLGLLLIVEGIETSKQLQVVDSLGIDIIQGYKVGRPCSIQNLIKASA